MKSHSGSSVQNRPALKGYRLTQNGKEVSESGPNQEVQATTRAAEFTHGARPAGTLQLLLDQNPRRSRHNRHGPEVPSSLPHSLQQQSPMGTSAAKSVFVLGLYPRP